MFVDMVAGVYNPLPSEFGKLTEEQNESYMQGLPAMSDTGFWLCQHVLGGIVRPYPTFGQYIDIAINSGIMPKIFGETRVAAQSEEFVADDPVYLYLLMRTDVPGLNPGKAVAQGSHAANQMVFQAREKDSPDLNLLLNEWEKETSYGFGTCIALGVTNADMEQAVTLAKLIGLHAGITHDPSYPLREGNTTHLLPVNTCGYIFSRKSAAAVVTSKFKLMD